MKRTARVVRYARKLGEVSPDSDRAPYLFIREQHVDQAHKKLSPSVSLYTVSR